MTLLELLDSGDRAPEIDGGISEDLAAHYFPLLARMDSATIGVHERKGTAMLRRITALPGGPPEDIWTRTMSTDRMLDDADRGLLKGPVLLIDDLLRTGRTVIGVVGKLVAAGVPAENICVAVLGSHESFDTHQLTRMGVEVRIWRKHLTDMAYATYRSNLVRALRGRPTPVLDTEHLELRIDLERTPKRRPPSFLALAEALGRTGRVAALPLDQDGGRLSIWYPNTSQHPDTATFGLGMPNETVVRKSRLIELSRNQYTLRSICLPDYDGARPVSPNAIDAFLGQLFGKASSKRSWGDLFQSEATSTKEEFFRSSLVASLAPMMWALEDLYSEFGSAQVQVSMRGAGRSALTSSGHLAVSYPTLDLATLDELAMLLITTAKQRAVDRPHRERVGSVEHFDAAQLEQSRHRLLQEMSNEVDRRLYELALGVRDQSDGVGLEHSELQRLGKAIGLSLPLMSALLDDVLDRALFSTKVETIRGSRTVRTYKPDGEVTTQALRNERRSGGFAP